MTAIEAAADLIVVGRIATLAGPDLGWVEAIAIRAGRIVAAGGRADGETLRGRGTELLRLPPGVVAMPGITDAHLHLADAAIGAAHLDLEGTPSVADAASAVGRRHRELTSRGDRDGWILGRGWSLDALGEWPSADVLETAAPGRRVALWSHDHHGRWLSRAALAASGISRGTTDARGGVIGRSADGVPNGLLFEGATTLVDAAIPDVDEATLEAAVLAYARELASLGVVGCHDPGDLAAKPELPRGIRLYRALAGAGRLPLRVHGSLRVVQLEGVLAAGLRSGDTAPPLDGGDPLARRLAARSTVGWLKQFADGALGSRTAALLAPYEEGIGQGADGHGRRGLLTADAEELAHHARRAAAGGIASQIHAIGDRAVGVALDALTASGAAGTILPVRARVEHVQLLDEEDVGRFRDGGVVASMQPGHLLEDAHAVERSWGRHRAGRSFAWGTLARAGTVIAFGTDAPVSPPDPWPGIAVAAHQDDPDWSPALREVMDPGQSLGLPAALRAACHGPLLAAGEGIRGGILSAGRRADLIVVPAAGLEEPVTPRGALAETRSRLTLIDGQVVHRDPDFDA